jgi:ATP-binding cassette subfamily C (CFTR/MRP) protein 1
MIIFAAFSIEAKVKHYPSLTTDKAFTSLSLIMLINLPAATLLNSYPVAIAALGCFKRIQTFLESEDFRDERTGFDEFDSAEKLSADKILEKLHPSSESSDTVVSVSDFALKPGSDEKETSISFDIKRGTITLIVGPVGSGKTTILKAVLGESRVQHGCIRVNDSSMAYCAQNPWLQSGTIRDNIIGPGAFLEEHYNEIIWLCALGTDLRQMPDEDRSEIGSRGLALSGGQKHRIVSLHLEPVSTVSNHLLGSS